MTAPKILGGRYWILYPLWIAFCAILFFALGGIGDPARPTDRIENPVAARLAVAELRKSDPARFADYEVVHVTFADADDLGSPRSPHAAGSRWLVLCDHPQRSKLRDAVVVELDARTGQLIRMRKVVLD